MGGFGNWLSSLPGKFGMGQGGMSPPMQGGAGVPSVMGFPAMPGSAPRQVPQGANKWAQRLDIIGSGLREASGEQGQLEGAQERIAGAAKAQKMAAFRDTLPPEQQQYFDLSPDLWMERYGKPQKAERPQRFNTPLGVVEFGEDGPELAYPYPEKPTTAPSAPAGYRWRSDGMGLEYIPGGPADPKTVGVIASGRRAPPRKPAGAGPSQRGSSGSALGAIEAELRRRGAIK